MRADGQPQASPVWFLWDGTAILVFSQPNAQKLRNLAANPRVAVHLDSDGIGGDIVTIDATAAVDPDAPQPIRWRATWPSTRPASRP